MAMIATMPSELLKSSARERAVELLGHYEKLAQFAIEVWEATRRETLRMGDAEALHAQRDQCESFFKGELERIDDCLKAVAPQEDREAIRSYARLTALRDQLATKYNELFPKWQTLDDLEDILLAPLQLSQEQCIELAKRFPPPQSWYGEDFDPFTPEEPSP